MFNANRNADNDDAFRHVEKTTTVVTAVKPLFLHRREQSKHALHLFIIISHIGSVRTASPSHLYYDVTP